MDGSLKRVREITDMALKSGILDIEIQAIADWVYQKECPGSSDIKMRGLDILEGDGSLEWMCDIADVLMRNGFKDKVGLLMEGLRPWQIAPVNFRWDVEDFGYRLGGEW